MIDSGLRHLSPRLRAVASMVTQGNRLADIGTDHGYLPIALVQSGVVPEAIAADIRPGPLEAVRQHVDECSLNSCIRLRLSDGLDAIQPGEADSIVIAGMGGALICRILERGGRQIARARELILSPQSEIPSVRHYLAEHGFRFVQEDLVRDRGKYYFIMKVIPPEADVCGSGSMHAGDCMLTEAQETYGPILLQQHHPMLLEWIAREERIDRAILAELEKTSDAPTGRLRREEILHALHLAESVQKELETQDRFTFNRRKT